MNTTWSKEYSRPGTKLTRAQVDMLAASCTNYDMPEIPEPLVYLAYPGISVGITRLDTDGVASGTGILMPCAHPIRIKAKDAETIQMIMAKGFPVRCGYCIAEAELYGTD